MNQFPHGVADNCGDLWIFTSLVPSMTELQITLHGNIYSTILCKNHVPPLASLILSMTELQNTLVQYKIQNGWFQAG